LDWELALWPWGFLLQVPSLHLHFEQKGFKKRSRRRLGV